MHIVAAWASEEGVALGQVATEEKSNEITAIPQLLEQIDLKNTLITIDAMGCQKDIVQQIVEGKGDCVLAVKDNQPKLKAAVESFFDEQIARDFEDLRYRHHETRDEGRGRIDERAYYLAKTPRDFAPSADWPQVKALGYALRFTQYPDGRETCEVRYYILTCNLSGKRFAEAVRGHWSIESMHWVLDVTFREDDSRSRERTLGDNLRCAALRPCPCSNVTPSKTAFVAKCSAAATTRAFSPKSLRSTRFDMRLAVDVRSGGVLSEGGHGPPHGPPTLGICFRFGAASVTVAGPAACVPFFLSAISSS